MQSPVYDQTHRIGRLHSPAKASSLVLLQLSATERLSEGFTIVIDAMSELTAVNLHPVLGEAFSVEFVGDQGSRRWFHGRLWEYAELGRDEHGYLYRLTLKPWTSFRTLNRNNRIFQNKNVKEIAESVLAGERMVLKLESSYAAIDYCVQYQESDFDFISRLFEHEGIYYYFNHTADGHELVAVDSRDAHLPQRPESVCLRPRTDTYADEVVLWSLTEQRSVGSARHVVHDYDFTTPSKDLTKSKSAAFPAGSPTERWGGSERGSGPWTEKTEIFSFPAKYTSATIAAGERYSERWLDAERLEMARSYALGNLFAAAAGRFLKIVFPDEKNRVSEYLIVGTTHRYSGSAYRSGHGGDDDLTVEVELIPSGEQYRPMMRTPRPRIYGPQTAVVVGPGNDEIYTDEYGRVKVHFFWDREGKKNEHSSCWIRVAQWTAGQAWGSFMLPRIGQEVIVEFLDGDPDRPLVTGAVYNADNPTPVKLPDMKTIQGIKTRTTTGGGGHNEILLDDKANAEKVSIRAQKDLHTVVDKGNELRELENGNRTTIIKKGNEVLEVQQGTRTTTIRGNESLEVTHGDRITTVSKGNDELTVMMGDAEVKIKGGSHRTEALKSIELKCGASKITLDQNGVTIEAVNIDIKGQMKVNINGLMVDSTAGAVQTIKGGLVKIN